MGQYCVFCGQTFISFTNLRNHTCTTDKPRRQRPADYSSTYFRSDAEKDWWIDHLLRRAKTVLSRGLTEDNMEDSLVKPKYKYTIEMNEHIDTALIENNPELSEVLIKSKQTFIMNKSPEKYENGKSEFVYVLENKDNDIKKEVSDTKEIPAVLDLSGNNNKRKRKSDEMEDFEEESKLIIDETNESDKSHEYEENLPRKIHVTDRMVNDENSNGKMSPDSGISNHGDTSDDGVLDFSMTKLETSRSSPESNSSDACEVLDFSTPKTKPKTESPKPENSTPLSLVLKSETQTLSSPKVSFNTPPVSVNSSMTSSSNSSSRKNRRKRSIPVRCERNEETSDITDIIQDYVVDSELVNKTVKPADNVNVTQELPSSESQAAVKIPGVKQNLPGPVDLTPKSATFKPVNVPSFSTPKQSSLSAPVDLSARTSPKVVRPTVKPTIKSEPATPVDLSAASMKKQKNNMNANMPMMPGVGFPGLLGGGPLAGSPLAGSPLGGGLMGGMPYNPLQMRQMMEMMYRMSPQNPNMVQAQIMQFHALLQNSMLNNRLAQMNNFNTMKTEADQTKVNNDKNDNIIKTENDSSNDSVEQELQNYSMNFIQKNGLNGLNNGFTSPGVQGVSPMMPGQAFTPSPVNTFRGKPGRRKNKDLLSPESSPASPKIESKLPPIELDSNSTPSQVVETLKSFFPLMPNADPTKQVDDNSPVGPRFFVTDNQQIQVIVDSLLNVGVLDLHGQELHGQDPAYKYVCRVCDQTFFHIEHLTKHVKKVHIVKKYQCTECDRSFHDAGNYRQHMRVHDDTDIPFECDVCNRRFRHKCTLKVHMRIHTGEKPFKCDVCDATFKISSGLQTHMRKHTGETPYACEFCDLRFKCQSNLKQHLFQHTQVRPFPCDICGKTYSRKSIRDAHLLTHAKEYIKNGITDISQVPGLGGSLSQIPMVGDISQVPMTVGGGVE